MAEGVELNPESIYLQYCYRRSIITSSTYINYIFTDGKTPINTTFLFHTRLHRLNHFETEESTWSHTHTYHYRYCFSMRSENETPPTLRSVS